MTLLDVSDVLADPLFASSLVVIRSVQSVGANGRATFAVREIPISGVVTAAQGGLLERMADAGRIRGSIMVHTTFRLFEASGSTDADVVRWQGRDYTVFSVADYSSYGAGFVAAECELKPLSP